MKFNWGTGIVLAFLIMISGMIYLVSITFRQNDDLVEDDYYQKSVNYQQHIEKVEKTNELLEKITFALSKDTLKLTFPNVGDYKAYSGKIQLYSPVTKKQDLTLSIKLNSVYSQNVDLKSLIKGKYNVKIDWSANLIDYFQEQEILVE